MANPPMRPEERIDRASPRLGAQWIGAMGYLNVSTAHHQESLDNVAEGAETADISPNSILRVSPDGQGITSSADPLPVFDGGFTFSRQMNYHNIAQLKTDTRPNIDSKFEFGVVNQVPKVCLTNGSATEACRLDFPSAPRRLFMTAYLAFRITAGANDNWELIIGDEPKNYTDQAVQDTGCFTQLVRNNGTLNWYNHNKGNRFQQDIVLEAGGQFRSDLLTKFRAYHNGIFFMRFQVSYSGGYTADDPTRVFSSLGRYDVQANGDDNLQNALKLGEGYNRVSGLATLQNSNYLGGGFGAPSGSASQVRTLDDYARLANYQRCLTIQNLSNQPIELFNVHITHGSRNNRNIAGL